jgi:hypothetical protein
MTTYEKISRLHLRILVFVSKIALFLDRDRIGSHLKPLGLIPTFIVDIDSTQSGARTGSQDTSVVQSRSILPLDANDARIGVPSDPQIPVFALVGDTVLAKNPFVAVFRIGC